MGHLEPGEVENVSACVVVTRGGWGQVWIFDGPVSAAHHPITQYGDAIVSSPEDVSECWNQVFLPRMREEVLRDAQAAKHAREYLDSAPDSRVRDSRLSVLAEEVWDELQRMAQRPPADPAEVVEIIVRDRRLYDEWHHREQTRRSPVTEATTSTAPKAETKAAAPKTHGGFALTAKISFGKDKDGKSYGPDNNPKRAGSKSADLFKLYKQGMTVQQAQDAGISAAALTWDTGKGFISIA